MDSFNPSQIPTEPKILVTNSKSIIGYSYDAQNYTLDVFFKGKGASVYRYFMVYPGQMSQIFDQPNSVGKALRDNVKGLRYQKLK